MVGILFTGSAVIGIIVSQFLARFAQIKGDRKTDRFLLRAGHVGLRCCLLEPQLLYFAVYRRLSPTSFGSTANPQMFALAREHADRTGP